MARAASSVNKKITNRVSASKIKFSQPTASQNFSSHGTINDTISALRRGEIKVDYIPAIRVVERNGELITLDNRRLAAFNAAGVDNIPIQKVSLSDPAIRKEFLNKFNPINGGQNIVITPNSAGRKPAEEILRSFNQIE